MPAYSRLWDRKGGDSFFNILLQSLKTGWNTKSLLHNNSRYMAFVREGMSPEWYQRGFREEKVQEVFWGHVGPGKGACLYLILLPTQL